MSTLSKVVLAGVTVGGVAGSGYLLLKSNAQTSSTPLIDVSNSAPAIGGAETVSGSNFAPNSAVTIALTGADTGSASTTTDATGTFASVSLPASATKTAGTVTVTATDANHNSASTSYTVQTGGGGGGATSLTAGAQAGSAAPGALDPLHAKATDASGAAVTGISTTFQIQSGTSWNNIATRPNSVTGIATYPYIVPTTAGTYILRATCPGATGTIISAHFTIIVGGTGGGTVATLTAGAQSPTAAAGTSDTLHAKALDSNGLPVTGVSTTFAIKSGSTWQIIGTRPNGVNGIATYPYVVPTTPGTYTYRAITGTIISPTFTILVS